MMNDKCNNSMHYCKKIVYSIKKLNFLEVANVMFINLVDISFFESLLKAYK